MLNKEVDTIIVDLDGTLSEEISWLKITEGLGAPPEKHAQIFADFRAGKLNYPEAKRQLIALWQSTGNANKTFFEGMFRSWKLKDDAQETIDYLKKSYRICLISGAVDLWVQIVAEKLGIADWYANTELIWDRKGSLIDFNYSADQSQKKLEQFEAYITAQGLDKEKCAVIGDGDSDISLFRELPYGIEVNKEPNPELKGLAHETVKELKELREIF